MGVNVNLPKLNSEEMYSGRTVDDWEKDLSSSNYETRSTAESVLRGAVDDLRSSTGIYQDPR